MRLVIAIKAFFAAIFDQQMAAQMDRLLTGAPAIAGPDAEAADSHAAQPKPASKPLSPPPPARDAAVTLLAALQREARLVDLIQEDLSQYSDAQVGSAARPCLQQCAGVLSRLFDLKPLVSAAEGDSVDVAENASPMRYQWIGEGTAAAGKLVHHGWEAAKIELPQWSGDNSDANVIAPAQVQAP